MDALPYAFCDSIASILSSRSLRVFRVSPGVDAIGALWKTALEDHFINRWTLELDVTCEEASWAFGMRRLVPNRKDWNAMLEARLSEIKTLSAKYLQVTDLRFNPPGKSLFTPSERSTFTEIRSFLEFVRPFICQARLNLSLQDVDEASMQQLMSALSAGCFRSISVDYSNAYEEFLRIQMRSERLSELVFMEECPDALNDDYERFRLRGGQI